MHEGSGSIQKDSRYAWYGVAVLFFAHIMAYVDRYALTLLVPLLKSDLLLSDTQVSLIQGLSFALFFALAGIPLGRLVDRRNRRNLLAAGIFAWSVMTIACALANDFWWLFFARMGVGIGEAVLAPAAYSLLADYFSHKRFGRAAAIMLSGATLGSAAATGATGLLLAVLPAAVLLPLLGSLSAWQVIFLCFGFPGFVIAGLMLTIREPERSQAPVPAAAATTETDADAPGLMRYMGVHRRVFVPLLGGLAFNYILSYAMLMWVPVVLSRVHGMPLPTIGYQIGLIYLLAGVPTMVGGGFVSDWMARRWPDNGRVRLLWAMYMAITPVCLGMALITSAQQGIVLYTMHIMLAGMFGGVLYPVVVEAVPGRLRGQTVAVAMLIGNLLGMGVAPTLVALATDYLYRDEMKVDLAMVTVGVPAGIGAVLLLGMAMRPYARLRAQVRLAEA